MNFLSLDLICYTDPLLMCVLQHGSESKVPLKYSHIDIAASSGDIPNDATGAPILGLVGLYLKDRY